MFTDYASLALCDDKIIAKRHSMSMADEIYAVGMNGEAVQLTMKTNTIYDQLDMARVEERWMKTTDGKRYVDMGCIFRPISIR